MDCLVGRASRRRPTDSDPDPDSDSDGGVKKERKKHVSVLAAHRKDSKFEKGFTGWTDLGRNTRKVRRSRRSFSFRRSPRGRVVPLSFKRGVTRASPAIECQPDGAQKITGTLAVPGELRRELGRASERTRTENLEFDVPGARRGTAAEFLTTPGRSDHFRWFRGAVHGDGYVFARCRDIGRATRPCADCYNYTAESIPRTDRS